MKNFELKLSTANECRMVRKKCEQPYANLPGRPVQDFGGVRYRFEFPNGYGASVIKRWGSYGYEDDLWEIALLNKYGELAYEYDFDVDVIGYCTDEEIDELLTKISKYGEEVLINEH